MTSTLTIVQGIGTGPFGTMGPGSGFSTALVESGNNIGFENLSFEEPDGSYPTLTTINIGPFGLSPGFNITFYSSGVFYDVAFYPGTRGSVSAGVSEPYNLTVGADTLIVTFDSYSPVTVQFVQGTTFSIVLSPPSPPTYALFNGATLILKVNDIPPTTIVFRDYDFIDITAATNSEVAAVIGATLTGVNVVPTGPSNITITTDFLGEEAEVIIIGGSGVSEFTTASTTPGVGNVQDLSAVTAAEAVHVLNAATPHSLSRVGAGNALVVASASYGPPSQVVVAGSATPAFVFGVPVPGATLIADMANVTAAEVTAALQSAGSGLRAVASLGNRVSLTTYPRLAGDIATIEVTGGAANLVFGFPTNVVSRGIVNPGYARQWVVGTISQGWSFVEFALSGPSLFSSAYEEFAKGWPASTAPDAFTDVRDISGSTVSTVFFGVGHGGPFLWESMDWFPYYTDITATIAATFSTLGFYAQPSSVETHSNGYRSLPGSGPNNEYDSVSWSSRLLLEWGGNDFDEVQAEFNNETLPSETFNTDWGYKTSVPLLGNEGDVYDIANIGPARVLYPVDFGQVGIVETFTPATTDHTDIVINAVTVGNIYSVTIDGLRFSYVAQTGDTTGVISLNLISAILGSNSTQASMSYNFGSHVVLQQSVPGRPMTVEIDGTNPSELSIVENNFVIPTSSWPGKFWNPSV